MQTEINIFQLITIIIIILIPIAIIYGAYRYIDSWMARPYNVTDPVRDKNYNDAIERRLSWSNIERSDLYRTALREEFYGQMSNVGLSCAKCSSLAYPLPDSQNRYRCPKCSHQFSGSPHNIKLDEYLFISLPGDTLYELIKDCGFKYESHALESRYFKSMLIEAFFKN